MDATSFGQASLAARLALAIGVLPLVLGIAYVFRPGERLLSLMRPLSLAGIFSAVANLLLGLANALAGVSRGGPVDGAGFDRAAAGLAEAALLPFIGFVCLTVAWLSVAIGMMRQR